MVGWGNPQRTYRQLSALLKKGIEFIKAVVTRIDVGNRKAHTEEAELPWDYLVIALDSEMSYDPVPGLADKATPSTLWTAPYGCGTH